MENNTLTYNEFLAYLLLYAANADFNIEKKELDIIHKVIDDQELEHVKKEFEHKNDAQRLEVIMENKKIHFDPVEDKQKLFTHLKDIFLADEQYLAVEKAVFLYLRKLLGL
ncbi:MAG: TerB family tellurite resistance protein [Bacteroidales bacterium]|nr:TerB family tellurite resistance protein [Bacteroidales bacterium]